jgi:YesN/AraC family two-component response regulator
MESKIKLSIPDVHNYVPVTGFAKNRKLEIAAHIKELLKQKVWNCESEMSAVNISFYLTANLHLEYTYLSHVFSQNEAITIEKYLISLKIERVKELIRNGEDDLTYIAWKVGYSSRAHLSAQFKKVTSLTPASYRIAVRNALT